MYISPVPSNTLFQKIKMHNSYASAQPLIGSLKELSFSRLSLNDTFSYLLYQKLLRTRSRPQELDIGQY